MNEQIKSDWETLKNLRHQPFGDPTAQPFEPTTALAFALGLAESKDEEQAIEYRMSHQPEEGVFCVAAHFALPYLLSQTNGGAETNPMRPVPFVALASGVVSFLERLESQYGKPACEDE